MNRLQVTRRAVGIIALLSFFGLGAGLPAAAEPDLDEAKAMITTLANDALAILADTSLTKDQREDDFSELFGIHFSIRSIGKFTLGRYWRGATEDERERFLDIFRVYVVKTYTIQLVSYAGENIEILSASPDGENGALVESRISPPDGEVTLLDWVIRETSTGLKVVDVRVENISMAITQRDDFASIIQRRGGTVDGLINALNEKLDELDEQAEALMD